MNLHYYNLHLFCATQSLVFCIVLLFFLGISLVACEDGAGVDPLFADAPKITPEDPAAMESGEDDEIVEVTPHFLRLRKKLLSEAARKAVSKNKKSKK